MSTLAEETDLEMVCIRCRNRARKGSVLYLIADGKAVHVAVKQAPRGALPQVCGGLVVPVGGEWLARLVPGGVVRARRAAEPVVHRVRLGRRVRGRGACGEWEGTALCGAAGDAWDPSPEGERTGETCPACGH